jgi:cobalt-zinc-cadmium efflux system outer membrane protein
VKHCRILILILAFGSTCHAQSVPAAPTAPAHPLTLAEAIARATANSPRIRQAQSSQARAAASTRTARAYSNPTVEVYAGRQYARPIATPGVPGLLQHYGALQPIEIPSERRARRDAALAGQRSAEAERNGVSLTVVADAKHAFYNALRRREEINHAQENLQLVQDLRRRVEVEVNVGEKGRLELTRADAELGRARFAVRSAQIEYSNAIAVLRASIAAAPDENLDPQGDLEPPAMLPVLTDARALVLQAHPAIAQSQAEIERAKASLRDQQALRIPQPTAFAEFENQPDLRYWRAGLNVQLPLFDRRRGQIDDARATIEGNTALLQQRRLELISSLERAYEQYQVADQQVQSLQSGELHAAESAVEGAKAAYRFGERGILEVLDAQRVLQSVRADLLDAQFARQGALVDLEELGVKP